METKVKTVNGILNKAGNNNKTAPVNNTAKVNNLPVSTAFNDSPKKEEAKPEPAKTETPKAEETKPQTAPETPKTEKVEQQHEPTKKELKEQVTTQHVFGLDETVKLVEQLGKKIAQKNKLQNTIDNLDNFTIAQHDDNDDLASDSRFQRCELVITDDNGNEFVTKNPFIIGYVAHEVRQLCIDKLAEVEASIIIP